MAKRKNIVMTRHTYDPENLPAANSRENRRLQTKYKAEAKRRRIDFKLDLDECRELFWRPCDFCGQPPSNVLSYMGKKYPYSGIDRKWSNKPYEAGNVVSCCRWCNSLKASISWKSWADFINGVAKHNGGISPFPEVQDLDRAMKSNFRVK